jgi:hypothetical protein
VTLSATDATSGVATTQYSVDGGDWTQWRGAPVSVTGDGDHVVEYRSTDVAGNVEATKAVTVSVDGTGPTLVVTGVAHGQVYGDAQVLAVDWEARDAGSGVASVTATLDGAPMEPGAELVLADLFLGLHDLVVTATDQVGNTSTQRVTFATATSFVDMAELVRRYEEAGFVSASRADELVDQLDRASREAIKGRNSKAISALQQFRSLADRSVTDDHARTVLHRDADAMIVRLGGTPSRTSSADNHGRTLSGAGRLADEPTTREVAPLE